MGKRVTIIILAIAFYATGITAQNISLTQSQQATQILQDRGEIVFSFNVSTKEQINNDLTHIISIDNVKPSAGGGFDVIAYANEQEFQTFLSRNIPFEIIPKDAPKALTMATTVAQMSTWDKYPTYSVYEQMMAGFASTYPTLCKIDTILSATPSGNYKILVAKISDNVTTAENEPQFLYSSSIHGDETTGYYLMLRMINYLLTNYGSITQVTNLVNGAEIWICPLANPEGTYYNSSPIGSTVANSRRYNLAGVDLNRNYKDPVGGDHPDGYSWQPETQAFMTFADNHHFNMGGNFHGGAEVMNYPWDAWTTAGNPNADAAWWERVCTNYVSTARTITPTYMTDTYSDGVTEGGDWYVVYGGRQDYMGYFHHCREVTIELDGTKTTATENLNARWNTNYQSLLNYMTESLYGIRGIITDSCTGQPIRAKVFANSYDQANDSSHVYSALPVGNYHKYVNTGTYSLTYSAPGYVSKTISGLSVTNGTATYQNVALVPLAPVSDFAANVTSTCSGIVQFTNTGTYPAGCTFLWNFGDGQTSTLENPEHSFAANGTYTVQLTITACSGSDNETKTSYITVNMPAAPIATGASICGSGTATLTASGTNILNWYSDQTGGTLLGTGSSYTTPTISATTTYYVENNVPASPVNVGPVVGGASRNVAAILYFDVYEPMTLVSVQAMAGTAGSKTITLLDNTGATVYSSSVNVNTSTTTVTLNWVIQPGTGYQLLTPVNSTLYRINSGVSYPYTATGLCSITGCDIGSTYFYSWFNWTVKGAGCSSARVPVTATVQTSVAPSFAAVGPYCVSATPAALASTSTNGITGTWSPATISTASAGTTTYTFTPTAGQCATTASMDVVVNANATPAFTALGPYCTGSAPASLATTSTNGITGTWNPAAISTASAGTSTYNFTPTAGQCAVTTSMNIAVNDNVTPSFTALGPYCQGDAPGTLAATSTNGVTGTWNPATISTSTAGSSSYTFTPSAGQCATTTNMSISVTAATIPSFSQLGPYCQGSTPGTLLTTSTNGITGSWSPSAISTSTSGTTTYTFTPDAGQCAAVRTMDIEVGTSITASFDAFGPYCEGSTADILPTTSNNSITGTWSPAAISTASAGSSSYTFTPDGGQCAVASSINVSVVSETTPTFSAVGPYCVGETPATLSGTSTNGFTGTWSPSVISTSVAGTTAYQFTPDAGQCAQDYSMDITVNSGITPSFSIPNSYCIGSAPVSLPATSGNNITGTWNPSAISTASAGTTLYTFTPDAGQCAGSISVNVSVNPEYSFNDNQTICYGDSYSWQGNSYTSPGTYTINHMSSSGCDSTYTLNLTVLPQYSSSESRTICPGSSFTWHGSTYSNAGTYYFTDVSSTGCDSLLTLNLSTGQEYAISENHSICQGESYFWHGTSYSVAGTYTASYSTVIGCDSIYTLNLSVNPQPVVSLGNDTSLCIDQQLLLDAGNPGSTYLWSENGATSQTIVFDPAIYNTGDTILVWVSVDNGCTANDTIEIAIPICEGIAEAGKSELVIFPNPTSGTVFLNTTHISGETIVYLMDASGKMLSAKSLSTLQGSPEMREIDLSEYAPGVYYLQVISNSDVKLFKILRE